MSVSLSPSGIVTTSNVAPATSNTPANGASTSNTDAAASIAPSNPALTSTSTSTAVPAPSITPTVPAGPRVPHAGRPTVRTGLGRNTKFGAPRPSPATTSGNTQILTAPAGGPVMHPAMPFRSARNNNLTGPINGPAAPTSASVPANTPSGPRGSRAPTTATPAPQLAPHLRADRNTRVDPKKKDVVISSSGILRNQGRYEDKIVSRKQKYVLVTSYHLPGYDMAEDFKSLTQAERRAYWVKAHVEITVDLGSATLPADIIAIVGHMDTLGTEFFGSLANFFVNLYFPNRLLTTDDQKLSDIPSINALTPLVQKLAIFASPRFVVVTMHTHKGRYKQCEWEWLDHAAPFCQLPYDWSLDWWLNTEPAPHRYRPSDEEYQAVGDTWIKLCHERDAVAARAAAAAAAASTQEEASKGNSEK